MTADPRSHAAIGLSRGGLTTEIRPASDADGRPLALVLTEAAADPGEPTTMPAIGVLTAGGLDTRAHGTGGRGG